MKTIKTILQIILLSIFIVLFANYSQAQGKHEMNMQTPGIQKAICVIYPTAGNNVSGTITFTWTDKGIKVVADLMGLSKGKHGFHIHDYGDCSSADGISAGGHFNPEAKSHGAPMDMMRHEGDMGNLEADDSGKAHLEYVDPMLSFDGKNSIIGRSVIIHKSEDDFKTQPTGNSGARIGCGVIGIAK